MKNIKASENKDLRIVLIGKTGSGKSASGNTILSQKVFQEERSSESVTEKCQKQEMVVNNRTISVIDTPGLFDLSVGEEQLKEEIEKSVEMSAPGPHVFLLVIKLDDEEKNTVKMIQETFGEEAVCYTVVLFTRGDQLKTSIEEFLDENKQISALVEQCRGRYHVFSNKDEGKPSQVSELLEKMDRMLEENGGQFYTAEMMQEAQRRRLEEEPLTGAQKAAYVGAGLLGGVIGGAGAVAGATAHAAVALVAAPVALIAAGVAIIVERGASAVVGTLRVCMKKRRKKKNTYNSL